jgi:DNA mismatch endonuclease (patch repair protein)
MAAVKSKDTTPELVVRRLAHRLGYRFRVHVRALPGTPDLVFPRLRKIIEVHGCFWYLHNCGGGRIPTARRTYWTTKFARNRERDKKNRRALHRLGWKVLTVWECQTKDPRRVEQRLLEFLADHGNQLHAH